MKSLVSLAAPVLLAFVAFPFAAKADTAGISFVSPGPEMNNDIGFSLGYRFTTNQTITVSALGYFDDGGLNETHEVGLFSSNGSLLASTTVNGQGTELDFFNYNAITPLTLAAGQTFEILGTSGLEDLYTYETNGFTVNPSITFVSDEYAVGEALQFGTGSEGMMPAAGGGFFGANFQSSAVTPEPGSLLLLGSGLLGSVGVLRRRADLR